MTDAAVTLDVEKLTFAYPGLLLFDEVSHVFEPGLTWVRGENGSGKSTLLMLLGGVLEPRDGHIRAAGVDARARPIDYRRRVYWCGPGPIAFDHLTPFEFFGFIAGLYPTFDRAAPSSLVDALGLQPFVGRRIRELSTGSRRKVAVIAAIASGTDVVLLDEPLAALDRASSAVVRSHLADAATQRDRVWIVTSHEPLGTTDGASFVLERPARN